jgi:hypothetical protein
MKDKYFNKTTIHTRVNSQYRISSLWREYGNFDFNEWAWETFVWKRDGENETIDYQPDTYTDIQSVLELHKILYDKIENNQPYEDDEN